MSEFFEIAYATANNGLCLFTGTGFSKAISENAAPGWQDLLEDLCDKCKDPAKMKRLLFPSSSKNPFPLDEAAQVLSIEMLKNGKNIHNEIADLIRKIGLTGYNTSVQDFCRNRSFVVVTTNYDKLIEQLSEESACQSLTPGLPIPRSNARVKVYHVHGSIDVPEKMVVTANDYFRFLNSESYFSRKLSTILHENTVVILGYSLGDTNLKAILSEYRSFARDHVISSNIFFVSRSKIDTSIKDYYSNCYGIRVIDHMTIKEFFDAVESEMSAAKKCAESSIKNIRKVVSGKVRFTDNFLKLERSFYEIVSSISAAGYSLENEGVVTMFGDIIEAKSTLTSKTGAWEQYTHLANWLIYIATILEMKSTSIEEIFLDAVQKSMEAMSKDMMLGFSWQAYRSWHAKWDGITPSNRTLIRGRIIEKSKWPDAIAVTELG